MQGRADVQRHKGLGGAAAGTGTLFPRLLPSLGVWAQAVQEEMKRMFYQGAGTCLKYKCLCCYKCP